MASGQSHGTAALGSGSALPSPGKWATAPPCRGAHLPLSARASRGPWSPLAVQGQCSHRRGQPTTDHLRPSCDHPRVRVGRAKPVRLPLPSSQPQVHPQTEQEPVLLSPVTAPAACVPPPPHPFPHARCLPIHRQTSDYQRNSIHSFSSAVGLPLPRRRRRPHNKKLMQVQPRRRSMVKFNSIQTLELWKYRTKKEASRIAIQAWTQNWEQTAGSSETTSD